MHAFTALGGVPTVHIRYDDLKAAVSRVLFGRSRVESTRCVTLRSHYGFDAFWCAPGADGAHEKGGVEREGGRFRRTHLVPMPVVASISELNTLLGECDAKDEHGRIGNRTVSVGAHFAAAEQDALRPLPVEAFETGITLTPRVDRYARVSVRAHRSPRSPHPTRQPLPPRCSRCCGTFSRHHTLKPVRNPGKGGPLRNSNFRHYFFDPVVRRAGLGPLTPHNLRDTAAGLAVASGANVKAVQRMLGHASASMTLDVYSGLFDADLDDVAERMNKAAVATLGERARQEQTNGDSGTWDTHGTP